MEINARFARNEVVLKLKPQNQVDSSEVLTTTPPSKIHPTIVVPVLVAFGRGTPLACRAALRVWLEKSKPGMMGD